MGNNLDTSTLGDSIGQSHLPLPSRDGFPLRQESRDTMSTPGRSDSHFQSNRSYSCPEDRRPTLDIDVFCILHDAKTAYSRVIGLGAASVIVLPFGAIVFGFLTGGVQELGSFGPEGGIYLSSIGSFIQEVVLIKIPQLYMGLMFFIWFDIARFPRWIDRSVKVFIILALTLLHWFFWLFMRANLGGISVSSLQLGTLAASAGLHVVIAVVRATRKVYVL